MVIYDHRLEFCTDATMKTPYPDAAFFFNIRHVKIMLYLFKDIRVWNLLCYFCCNFLW